jgi:hypothetical protein
MANGDITELVAILSAATSLIDHRLQQLLSAFDRSDRAIGAAVDLVVPAAFFVLVGNPGCLTRCSLLARSKFGRLASGFSSWIWLGVRTVCLIRPAAVMLKNFVGDFAQFIDPRI